MTGKRIRESRVDIGMTQEDLGNRMGVGKSTISEWESGKRKPDIDAIILMAKILQVPVSYLGEFGTTTDEEIKFALFGAENGITDEQYDEVKRFARYIKEKSESEHR